MLIVKYSNLFKKDLKLMQKRGRDINKLKEVIRLLANNEKLPDKYRDHYLSNNYKRIQRMSYRT